MLKSKYQAFTDTLSENVFKAKKQANPITLVVLGYVLLIVSGAALLSLSVDKQAYRPFAGAIHSDIRRVRHRAYRSRYK